MKKKTLPIEKEIYGPSEDNYGRDPNPFDTECCVMCGEETPYLKSTHIDFRDYYIEGAGQLCKGCYIDLYEKRAK